MDRRAGTERRHLFSYIVCGVLIVGLAVATWFVRPWEEQSRQWLQEVSRFIRPKAFSGRLRATRYLNEALTALRQGNYVEAESKARAALKVSADTPGGWEILVLSLSQQGRWDDAEKAIQEAPSQALQGSLYAALADLAVFNGRTDQAVRYYEEALHRDPENHVVLNNYGYLLADRGERLEEAEKMIRKALQKRPREPAYLDSLGWVYYQKGQYKEALPLIEQAVKSDPHNAEVRYHLGMVYYRLGQWDKARAELDSALRLQPGYEPARKALDEIIYEKKRREMSGARVGA